MGIDKNKLLAFAINNCLEMADELEIDSLSIPAISTGSFGFDKKKCAQIMYECIVNYGMEKYETS